MSIEFRRGMIMIMISWGRREGSGGVVPGEMPRRTLAHHCKVANPANSPSHNVNGTSEN